MPTKSRAVMAVPLQAIVIALLIHVLWGGNPVAVKFSLLVFPPLWTAFFRFAIAIVCVGIWAKLSGIPIWPARHEWPALMLIGVLFTVQIASMNFGFDLTTGSMGAVLIATNPIFAALFAHFLLAGDKLTVVKGFGLLVAFVGTALVLMRGLGDLQVAHGVWGNIILLMSACPIRWDAITWEPLAGLAYQGVVVAGLGFTVSFYLMKRYTPSVIVSFNFVSPIAGVLLSAWLLGDVITGHLWAGLLLVAVGLFLITRR
jgi:drug/metabolite transporter (DMT)-like permease